MRANSFSRKALVSLAVVAAGSGILIAGVAFGNGPALCPANEEPAVAADIENKFVCVRNSDGTFRNRELHSGIGSGTIAEPLTNGNGVDVGGNETIGSWVYTTDGVVNYTYNGTNQSYTGRFCRTMGSNTVVRVNMLDSSESLTVTVSGSAACTP